MRGQRRFVRLHFCHRPTGFSSLFPFILWGFGTRGSGVCLAMGAFFLQAAHVPFVPFQPSLQPQCRKDNARRQGQFGTPSTRTDAKRALTAMLLFFLESVATVNRIPTLPRRRHRAVTPTDGDPIGFPSEGEFSGGAFSSLHCKGKESLHSLCALRPSEQMECRKCPFLRASLFCSEVVEIGASYVGMEHVPLTSCRRDVPVAGRSSDFGSWGPVTWGEAGTKTPVCWWRE